VSDRARVAAADLHELRPDPAAAARHAEGCHRAGGIAVARTCADPLPRPRAVALAESLRGADANDRIRRRRLVTLAAAHQAAGERLTRLGGGAGAAHRNGGIGILLSRARRIATEPGIRN